MKQINYSYLAGHIEAFLQHIGWSLLRSDCIEDERIADIIQKAIDIEVGQINVSAQGNRAYQCGRFEALLSRLGYIIKQLDPETDEWMINDWANLKLRQMKADAERYASGE